MNYKEKAEEYVRSKRPHLMEPIKGEIEKQLRKANTGNTKIVLLSRLGLEGETELTKKWLVDFATEKQCGIIGHPIQLQDWLGVLGDRFAVESIGGAVLEYRQDEIGESIDWHYVWKQDGSRMHFNLTTGQPATKEDYEAYCEIVGI